MKLYTYFRSSAAYRVRIALALKGLSYESMPKSLPGNEQCQPAYRSLNPQGLIPALAIDSTVLPQSLAIIEYLDECHPATPFLPSDPISRAQVRSMALSIACDLHPLNNLRVLNYLRQDLGQDEEAIRTWYLHWIDTGFTGLESQVQQFSTARRHCFGDAISLADICLVPQMYNAQRFGADLSSFPTLRYINAHLESQPAFAAARPEKQPDAT